MNTAINLRAKDLKVGMLVHNPGGYPSTGGLFDVVTEIYNDGRVHVHPYSWPIGHSSGRLLAPMTNVVVLGKGFGYVIVDTKTT